MAGARQRRLAEAEEAQELVPPTIRPQFEEFAFRLNRWSRRRELTKYASSGVAAKMFNDMELEKYLRTCSFEELNLFIARHAFVMLGDLW
jgi:hypothetical protein